MFVYYLLILIKGTDLFNLHTYNKLHCMFFFFKNVLEFQCTDNSDVQRSVFVFKVYLCYINCNVCIYEYNFHYNSIALESGTVFLKWAQSFALGWCFKILARQSVTQEKTPACITSKCPRKTLTC